MKKIFLLATVAIFSVSVANAQSMGSDYKNALGFKIYPGAISYKHFFSAKNATGLYEIHSPINSVEGLQWYIGPGAHVGFFNTRYKNAFPGATGAYFGVDGVLGLDYKINKAPINLSIDWQPSYTFGDYVGFDGGWGGLGVRYTF